LILFNLQYLLFIFAATALFGFYLFHAAIATGMRVINGKIPGYQPSHAIMQVYRGAHGGAQVKNGQYGNQELFHVGVKVVCFFGMKFTKFRGNGIEFEARPRLYIWFTCRYNEEYVISTLFLCKMSYSRISDIFIHVFAGLAFLTLPLLFMSGQTGNNGLVAIVFSVGYWIFCLTYVGIFYLNTYFLIPWLYLKRKYLFYVVIVLVLFALVSYGRPFEQLLQHHQPHHKPPPSHMFLHERGVYDGPGGGPPDGPRSMRIDIVSIFLYIMTIALGMAIQVTRQWRTSLQRVARAEADKAQAELSFLKAQINPHFLFNTLNNIYTLAITKNDKTADSIMKLSNIMRYVTDDVSAHFVPLQLEVDCIHDFIELQRLRLSKKVTVDFSVKGHIENKTIVPLLLITFVENVFKYGISNHENTTITIQLTADERSITFYCHNKIFKPAGATQRTGVGIANAQKRLEHLYSNKHLLNISNENGFFSVELILLA
jgi:two-component system LytT family sensor kinase